MPCLCFYVLQTPLLIFFMQYSWKQVVCFCSTINSSYPHPPQRGLVFHSSSSTALPLCWAAQALTWWVRCWKCRCWRMRMTLPTRRRRRSAPPRRLTHSRPGWGPSTPPPATGCSSFHKRLIRWNARWRTSRWGRAGNLQNKLFWRLFNLSIEVI